MARRLSLSCAAKNDGWESSLLKLPIKSPFLQRIASVAVDVDPFGPHLSTTIKHAKREPALKRKKFSPIARGDILELSNKGSSKF